MLHMAAKISDSPFISSREKALSSVYLSKGFFGGLILSGRFIIRGVYFRHNRLGLTMKTAWQENSPGAYNGYFSRLAILCKNKRFCTPSLVVKNLKTSLECKNKGFILQGLDVDAG